jgi:segregation and condensation protein A
MVYKVKLPIFEGPFDLLLFLIKKNEVDVYDIPVAEITHQYLEYLELMKMLDLDVAGEFIEMVATLMLIKVRLLLPRIANGEDEEIQDPRAQLVAQLLEYQRFKEVSGDFQKLETDRRHYFSRAVPEKVRQRLNSDGDELLDDVSLFDLLAAFKKALDSIPKVTVHQVNVVKVTIEQQVKFIFEKFGKRSYMFFSEFTKTIENKIELIVTFMAILDLIRLQFLSAKQSDNFGEIRLVTLQSPSLEKYLEVRDKELVAESETTQID